MATEILSAKKCWLLLTSVTRNVLEKRQKSCKMTQHCAAIRKFCAKFFSLIED
jgi:hypothetical protein